MAEHYVVYVLFATDVERQWDC